MMVNKTLAAAAAGWRRSAAAPRREPCGPEALGRLPQIFVGGAPRLGLKTYPQTLDLNDHEVVLTFDDGPSAPTPRMLAALAAQCAKATFFLIGRNAEAQPDLVRREIAEGHTVGSHSYSPPAPDAARCRSDAAMADIDTGRGGRGQGGRRQGDEIFPLSGLCRFASSCWRAVEKKNMPVFGTDLWASDWTAMTPEAGVGPADASGCAARGAASSCCMTSSRQTADMLPALLAALKAEHFQSGSLVPGDAPPRDSPRPRGLDLRNRGRPTEETGDFTELRGKRLKRA